MRKQHNARHRNVQWHATCLRQKQQPHPSATVRRPHFFQLPTPTMSTVHLIDHPLVQHKLTLMRRKEASTNSFRRMLGELSTLMAYELTRDFPLSDIEIETPMEKMTG